MSSAKIHGIIGYTITPFSAGGEQPDLKALGTSIDRMIESGVHAIAPLGSTGEGAYLSDAEWEQVSEFSIKRVAKRVPTVVSVSDLTTAKAIQRARFAEAQGADVLMVLPASYWKLSDDEILAHYKAIGNSVSVPIMLYNNPATSGIDMSVDLILKIVAAVDNVTMVKESTGDIQRMHKLHQRSEGQLPFYNGSNPLALEALTAGASGWCTAAPNLIPQLNLDLFAAIQNNDLAQARQLFYRQLPLLEFILKGGLPATIKAGLRLTGLDVGAPRLPVSPLNEAGSQQLSQMLKTLNVL